MPRGYDVIVIGCGAMGSAVCDCLARRGVRVLGLERFDIPHEMGSSHGGTRIIRKAYLQDPRYCPLVETSYALWRELEDESGEELLLSAGCLNMGPPDHDSIRGMLQSAQQHGLAHEVLDRGDIRRRWAIFEPNEGDVGVYEPDAGVLFPERCIRAYLERSRRNGAEIRTRTRVTGWRGSANDCRLETETETLECHRLVITAGAWLGELVPDLSLPLQVERQVQAWFRPAEMEAFSQGRMPGFIHFAGNGAFYGIPAVDERGVKFCRHHGGEMTTAETVRREVTPADTEEIRFFLARHVPAADGPPTETKVCLYTNTPDDHFIVDRLPEHPNVFVAGGFSGHGFKFAPVVAEAISDLIGDGFTAHPIGLFRMNRFGCDS